MSRLIWFNQESGWIQREQCKLLQSKMTLRLWITSTSPAETIHSLLLGFDYFSEHGATLMLEDLACNIVRVSRDIYWIVLPLLVHSICSVELVKLVFLKNPDFKKWFNDDRNWFKLKLVARNYRNPGGIICPLGFYQIIDPEWSGLSPIIPYSTQGDSY